MMAQPQRVKPEDMSGRREGPRSHGALSRTLDSTARPPRFPLNTDSRAHLHASDSCCTEGLGCVPRALTTWTGSQPFYSLTSHQALDSLAVMAARKGEDALGRLRPPSLVPGRDVEPGPGQQHLWAPGQGLQLAGAPCRRCYTSLTCPICTSVKGDAPLHPACHSGSVITIQQRPLEYQPWAQPHGRRRKGWLNASECSGLTELAITQMSPPCHGQSVRVPQDMEPTLRAGTEHL